ncbi:MAG: Tex-like N-terminal domain-containing protein [Ferruginibacter sp.]
MFAQPIAQKLNIKIQHVETVLQLLEGGATIPFIARYRKDMTGALDEVQIQQIQDEDKAMQEFAERKTFIEKTIMEQGKMTDALQEKINNATTISQLEDIYLPYKQKRKTKADTARENGLAHWQICCLNRDKLILKKKQQNSSTKKLQQLNLHYRVPVILLLKK